MPSEYIELRNKSINKSIIILISTLIIINLFIFANNLNLNDKIVKIKNTVYEQTQFNNKNFQNLKQDIETIDNLIDANRIKYIVLENKKISIWVLEHNVNDILYTCKDTVSIKSISMDNDFAKIQGEIK